jgi:CheY-like chemotaxis protein
MLTKVRRLRFSTKAKSGGTRGQQRGSPWPKPAADGAKETAAKGTPGAEERPLPFVSCGEKTAPSRRIRVLLADDHQMMREGLAALLNRQADIEVVGQAYDGEMAVRLACELAPDVVVMDVTMPVLSGIAATRRITVEAPGVRVIGLSMHEEAHMVSAMRKAGAVGYLTKDGASETLVAAIRACVRPGRQPDGR